LVDDECRLVGVVRGGRLAGRESRRFAELMQRKPVVAHPDEPLRAVVYRMAATGLTRFPVVDRIEPPKRSA